MKILITLLVIVSGLSEAIALPVAVRDGMALRDAFAEFERRPGSVPGTVASVLKAREPFLVDADVRHLSRVVRQLVPRRRSWLTGLALLGVLAGAAAGLLAIWA
jgi:hypothetical protein